VHKPSQPKLPLCTCNITDDGACSSPGQQQSIVPYCSAEMAAEYHGLMTCLSCPGAARQSWNGHLNCPRLVWGSGLVGLVGHSPPPLCHARVFYHPCRQVSGCCCLCSCCCCRCCYSSTTYHPFFRSLPHLPPPTSPSPDHCQQHPYHPAIANLVPTRLRSRCCFYCWHWHFAHAWTSLTHRFGPTVK